jgi:hypothetical protein
MSASPLKADIRARRIVHEDFFQRRLVGRLGVRDATDCCF